MISKEIHVPIDVSLTLCGLVMTPYGDIDLSQHWLTLWLGAWLIAMIVYHQRCYVAFTWNLVTQEMLMNVIHNMYSEITHLELLPDLTGSALTHWPLGD